MPHQEKVSRWLVTCELANRFQRLTTYIVKKRVIRLKNPASSEV